jgi:hypothetical protein
MATDVIFSLAVCLGKIPPRLRAVVGAYLLGLIVESSKHTMTWASRVGGGSVSRFSRLLENHRDLARDVLVELGKEVASCLIAAGTPLVAGAPWNVAIIVDATLHRRSSRHVHNAKSLSHGKGFVVGHQWTNVVLLIGAEVVPLPPIAFLTKKVCRERGVAYMTEHDRVAEYLEELDLVPWIGPHAPRSVVVLVDSGYDDRRLQRTVLARGWDFIGALKAKRTARTVSSVLSGARPKCQSITEIFRSMRKQAPWRTVHHVDGNGKRVRSRVRRIDAILRGVAHAVVILCADKANGKGRRYIACSQAGLPAKVILDVFRRRWSVELFHRAVKDELGLQHAGVEAFESLESHVQWVYCAYLLVGLLARRDGTGRLDARRRLTGLALRQPVINQLSELRRRATRFGGHRESAAGVAAVLQTAAAY